MGSRLFIIFLIIIIDSSIKIINCINKSSPNDISMCMVGDLLIHDPILNYAKSEMINNKYNFDFLFENIEKYIKEYDIKIINDKVLISGPKYNITGYPRFNSPIELSDSIVKAGFNVILKATNHVNDKNEEARLADLNNWKRFSNIKVLGSYENKDDAEKITFFEIKGVKIALLNYCYGSNRKIKKNKYIMNKLQFNKLKNDVEKSRNEGAELIIVMMHWGKEYSLKINEYQKKWTKIFFELGVDLVIGTHPHVIQPVEVIEDKKRNKKMYVFYSIGNFINYTSESKKDVFKRFLGGLAHIIIGKEKNKIIIKEVKFIPLITHIYPGSNKVTTFKVKDYNKKMAKKNYVKKKDKSFSYKKIFETFKNIVDNKFLDFDL